VQAGQFAGRGTGDLNQFAVGSPGDLTQVAFGSTGDTLQGLLGNLFGAGPSAGATTLAAAATPSADVGAAALPEDIGNAVYALLVRIGELVQYGVGATGDFAQFWSETWGQHPAFVRGAGGDRPVRAGWRWASCSVSGGAIVGPRRRRQPRWLGCCAVGDVGAAALPETSVMRCTAVGLSVSWLSTVPLRQAFRAVTGRQLGNILQFVPVGWGDRPVALE
jgi:hypothetical protein